MLVPTLPSFLVAQELEQAEHSMWPALMEIGIEKWLSRTFGEACFPKHFRVNELELNRFQWMTAL